MASSERRGPQVSDNTLERLRASRREGWMDSIDFDHELGHAIGGNKIYPDKQEVEALECIKAGDYCYPKRVYVFDADEFDAALAEPQPVLGQTGSESGAIDATAIRNRGEE